MRRYICASLYEIQSRSDLTWTIWIQELSCQQKLIIWTKTLLPDDLIVLKVWVIHQQDFESSFSTLLSIMLDSSTATNTSRQACIRAMIFVGLYLIVLLSITQCALVLYLYSTSQVDGLMTPSLIVGLIAVRINIILFMIIIVAGRL